MKPLNFLPFLAVFALATNAHAVLLVHEQFLTSDYTVDVTVENQNGGTGFDTAWTKVAGLASHVDYQPRTSGLSYSV